MNVRDAVLALEDETTGPVEHEPNVLIDTCHSTWLFDTQNHRFRRVLKGVPSSDTIATNWRFYDRLIVDDDSGAFIVVLDKSGTRLLRSRRHARQCHDCGKEQSSEMSVEDLRTLIDA